MARTGTSTRNSRQTAPNTGGRNRKTPAPPTQPTRRSQREAQVAPQPYNPPGQPPIPAQSSDPSHSDVNEPTQTTVDPPQPPESILRSLLINIKGNLKLQGAWNLQCYEYNFVTESLQLRRFPNAVLAATSEQQKKVKGKGKQTQVRKGVLETIDENDDNDHSPRYAERRGSGEEEEFGGESEEVQEGLGPLRSTEDQENRGIFAVDPAARSIPELPSPESELPNGEDADESSPPVAASLRHSGRVSAKRDLDLEVGVNFGIAGNGKSEAARKWTGHVAPVSAPTTKTSEVLLDRLHSEPLVPSDDDIVSDHQQSDTSSSRYEEYEDMPEESHDALGSGSPEKRKAPESDEYADSDAEAGEAGEDEIGSSGMAVPATYRRSKKARLSQDEAPLSPKSHPVKDEDEDEKEPIDNDAEVTRKVSVKPPRKNKGKGKV